VDARAGSSSKPYLRADPSFDPGPPLGYAELVTIHSLSWLSDAHSAREGTLLGPPVHVAGCAALPLRAVGARCGVALHRRGRRLKAKTSTPRVLVAAMPTICGAIRAQRLHVLQATTMLLIRPSRVGEADCIGGDFSCAVLSTDGRTTLSVHGRLHAREPVTHKSTELTR
jgi:hypothetical protein